MSNLNLYSLGLNDSTADRSIELTNKGGILLYGDSDATGIVTLDTTHDASQSFTLIEDIVTEDGVYFVETNVNTSVECDGEIACFSQNNKAIITKSGDTVTNHNSASEISTPVGTFAIVNSVTGRFSATTHDLTEPEWSNRTYTITTSTAFPYIDLFAIDGTIIEHGFIGQKTSSTFRCTVAFGSELTISKTQLVNTGVDAPYTLVDVTDISGNTLNLSKFTSGVTTEALFNELRVYRRTTAPFTGALIYTEIDIDTRTWVDNTDYSCTIVQPLEVVEAGDLIFVTIPVLEIDGITPVSTSKTFDVETVGNITTTLSLTLGGKLNKPNDLTLDISKSPNNGSTIVPIVKVESQVTRKKLN